jgi:hypothetical protein
MKLAVSLVLVAGVGIVPAIAQEAMKPAPVLSIVRESIKEGKTAAHEKVEAEFASAFRKANSPAHYYALSAGSGPSEVWFVEPMESFASKEDFDKAGDKEPLKGSLEAAEAHDGELRTSSHTMWAGYRADLSYRPEKLNLAKTRYVDLVTFRVKLGKEQDFVNNAKALFEAYAKGNVDLCTLGYRVSEGAPEGTYLLFTMMDSMKVLDGYPERMKAAIGAMGQDRYSQTMSGFGDAMLSIEHNLFEVKPGMSYPPQSVVDADPTFWKTKSTSKTSTAVSIPGPPEQKK